MKRVAFFAFLVFSLLLCQLPADMRTVEEQLEDTDVVIRLAGAGSNGCN